jgi:hypothetical protein
MIKVYVFVTGLALYQFASLTPGGTSYVILASGDYDYQGQVHIPKHELVIQAGNTATGTPFPIPLEATLAVNCPTGGCVAVAEPAAIPSLVTLLKVDNMTPILASGCKVLNGGATCHPRGVAGHDGRNGLLEFSGNWQVDALADCGGSFPNTVPPPIAMNFVRAGRAWELLYQQSPPLVANSVLFSTVINDMSELQISNSALQKMFDPTQIKLANCKNLYQFPSSAKQCVAVAIRNGSTDTYMGGGDLHYAALFALLDNPINLADTWLPIAAMSACTGGAGTGGLSHCTGGILPGN